MPRRSSIEITNLAIRSCTVDPGQRKELSDSIEKGLRLRISRGKQADSATVKSWSIQVRDPLGRLLRVKLGEYPDLSIREARERATKLRCQIAEGTNPNREKRKARTQARSGAVVKSLRDLIAEYGRVESLRLRRWKDQRNTIQNRLDQILDWDLNAISAYDVETRLHGYFRKTKAKDKPTAEGRANGSLPNFKPLDAPVQANRCLRYLRTIVRWGIRKQLLKADFTTGIKKPYRERARQRILSDDELKAVWPYLVEEYGQAAKLMLLTAARRGEVTEMAGEQIDWSSNTWKIPAEIHKSNRDHFVPLVSQAVALVLEKIPDRKGPVFKGLSNWDRWTKRVRNASGVLGWNRHDLRRTAASGMARLGVAPHIIEAALGHAHPGGSMLASTYQVHSYEPEIRAALNRWAEHVGGLISSLMQNPQPPLGETEMVGTDIREIAA